MLRTNILLLIFTLIILACNNGPKEMTPVGSETSSTNQGRTGVFDTGAQTDTLVKAKSSGIEKGLHVVKVKEVLPTDKYVYLLVNEDDEEYWIATKKQEVNVGEVYFYKNGLLKTNFESKEYNRVFDKVYLVSNITPANHGQESNGSQGIQKEVSNTQLTQKVKLHEGSLSIKEVVQNPKKYEGKTIQLTGTCVKVNPNIMKRNWIHLKDGSQDDYDFVVTSEIMVPEGHVITLKGVLSLNKDFGSGYRYDMILENGELIK